MKNILFALVLTIAAFTTNAQSQAGPKLNYPNDGTPQGQPRFGTGIHSDNSGNSVTYKYSYVVDKAGTDTFLIPSTTSYTTVEVKGLDGITLVATNSIKGNRVADELNVILLGTTGSESIAFNTNFQLKTAGSLTVGSVYNKAFIKFIFDGKIWIELYRQTL